MSINSITLSYQITNDRLVNHHNQCEECGTTFKKHHQLKSHVAEDHPGEGVKDPFECDEPGCDKSFTQMVHLKAHAKTHISTSESTSSSSTSPPSTSTTKSTSGTIAEPTPSVDRYMCSHPTCLAGSIESRQFPNWTELQRHHKTAHPPTCHHPECNGKTFTSNRGLKNHLMIHDEKEEGAVKSKKRMRGRGNKKKKTKKNANGETTEEGDAMETGTETETQEDTEMETGAELEAPPKKRPVRAAITASAAVALNSLAQGDWHCPFSHCKRSFNTVRSIHFPLDLVLMLELFNRHSDNRSYPT